MNYFFENRLEKIHSFVGYNLNFNAHMHDHIELVYILRGTGQLLLESNSYNLKPDDVLLIFPNTIHSYQNCENIKAYVIIISISILGEFKKVFLDSYPTNPIVSEDVTVIKQLTEIFFENATDYNSEIKKGLLIAILGIILDKLDLHEQEKYNISTLKSIFLYCNAHFNDPISIKDVSSELNISRSHISHVLRAKLNTSFGEYIRTKRIDFACKLLLSDNLSITETAFACGFESVRTFNRTFIQLKGCSPREYRIHEKLKLNNKYRTKRQ